MAAPWALSPIATRSTFIFKVLLPLGCERHNKHVILFTRRYTSSHIEDVRVRFAPSPTGFLHLGGLRTALYNFLYARSNNGKFILRIEDTDRTRTVPGAMQYLQDTLEWAGLQPDEGPGKGEYGPYIQSERLYIYSTSIKTLLHSGWAYPCFCTNRRLELMRRDAARRGEQSRYDNRCRSLSGEKVAEMMEKEVPFVVRLKLQPTTEPWQDLIKGESMHNVMESEGDPILVKSDGYPTYHFANVVDDHYMGITHVLRGDEWLNSTPKHILLYKAFGWTPPKFGHLPLIVNMDGSKLSKRQDDIHVEQFRAAGYFPRAVLNYIMSIGGGFRTGTGMQQRGRPLGLEEMCDAFDLSTVRRNPGRLDPNWLTTANCHILQETVKTDPGSLVGELRGMVMEAFGHRMSSGVVKDQVLSDEYILGVLRWSSKEGRAKTLKYFVEPDLAYLWVTPTSDTFTELAQLSSGAGSILTSCLRWVQGCQDFSSDALMAAMPQFMQENKLKKKTFFPVARMALTGLKKGAPLAEMMSVIGRDNTILRLEAAIDRLQDT